MSELIELRQAIEKFGFRLTFAGVIALTLNVSGLAQPEASQAKNLDSRGCEIFLPLFAHASGVNKETVGGRVVGAHAMVSAESLVAERALRAMIDGQMSFARAESCIDSYEEKNRMMLTLQEAFLTINIERLKALTTDSGREFARMLEKIFSDKGSLLFRLTGHGYGERQTDRPDRQGGFHCSSQSIFLDIADTHPDEWLLILVHEFAHALDPYLFGSLPVFSNEKIVGSIVEWSRDHADAQTLPKDKRATLDRWLMAVLDRNLLAAYRAWWVSARIYQDATRAGLWKRVSWFEEILKEQRAGESLERFIFRTRNARLVDPVDDMFSLPLVKSGLSALRSNIEAGAREIDLGPFAVLKKRKSN